MTTFLIVESTLAAGFTEEAIFRGVVLRSLEPKGWLSAAAISSLLFALVHLTGLFIGFNPLYIALQVLWAFLVGFSLAAPVLVTGWIWPAIILHFAINVISGLTSCKLVTTEKLDYEALATMLVLVGIFALLAVFGWWLLFHQRRLKDSRNSSLENLQGPIGYN